MKRQSNLKYCIFSWNMRSNIKTRQNAFFKNPLPKNKTEYVKFQTSVSLYLYFERNIANWIVNPTWNIVYFRGIWGQTLRLGKMHSSRTHCRKIKRNMSSFKHLYLCICTLRGILLIGSSIQLEISYIFVEYEVKIKTRQNSFFKNPLPKNKTEYVKFQTSVSLYLDFNANIAKWSVSPTWNFIFFYGMSSNVMAWQNSFFKSRLPKHKKQCVKFQTSVSLYLGLNGETHSSKLILHEPIAKT